MSLHLDREINHLKTVFSNLSTCVEENVQLALDAFRELDSRLAKQVIATDERINREEIDVEEECLKILALHHPVATDLRYIVAVIKMNYDLERIGDLSVNIARKVIAIVEHGKVEIPFDFTEIMEKVTWMLRSSLDALVNVDAKLARLVCRTDDAVDTQKRLARLAIVNQIKKTPDECDILIHMFSIARHLERIADHATNMAEDIIYLVEGEITRHQPHTLK